MRKKPFAAFVHYGPSCWEWIGFVRKDGYGIYMIGPGRPISAHRYAFQTANGPIPNGLFVCHRCDNPRCVRRDHLFLGTASDNSRDMAAKGRGYIKHFSHCPNGHEYTEQNTRMIVLNGRPIRRCRACVLNNTRKYQAKLKAIAMDAKP